jgi:hypothetical protein
MTVYCSTQSIPRLQDAMTVCCRTEEQEGEGETKAQPGLSKLADDLVQKFEDQWKATAENLDAAAKAFDNLEGMRPLHLAEILHKAAEQGSARGKLHAPPCSTHTHPIHRLERLGL